MLFYSKVKQYILRSCESWMEVEPSEEDKTELRQLRNWFLIKDGASSDGIEIERNFLSLLSLLELDSDATVVQFYSKLDYLQKKNQNAG